MNTYKSDIKGHLDIFVANNEEENDGVIKQWQEVLIHGDQEGLRSFARLLLKLADIDQESITNYPVGAREHYHLRPNIDISKSSVEVIVGRLDAKGTGRFYDRYVVSDKIDKCN
jgi:hypothetical protein